MDIKVSVIKDNDAQIIEKLKAIEKQAFGEAGLDEWNLVPFIRHGKVIALWCDNKLVGGAQYIRDWDEPSRAYLVGIAVDGSCRGQGLGTRFLGESLALLAAEGIKCVELTVDAQNHGAVKVYGEKLGFVTIGTRKDEYGAGVDRVVMEKRL